MSIANTIIDIIIYLINGIASWLPDSFSDVSVADFSNNIFRGIITLNNSYSFIEQFFSIKLLFTFLIIILVSEILMSFGVSGIKYLIKIIRG